MKKLVAILAVLFVFSLIATEIFYGYKKNAPVGNNTSYQYNWTSYPLIAHALGGINGQTYTNSLEALESNYNKGYRVFEVDLSLTSDGCLAANHGWDDYPNKQPPRLQEFKTLKISGKLTPLDFKDIALLMKKYKDIYVITDTKATDPGSIRREFEALVGTAQKVDSAVLNRVIPQIYNEEMLPIIMDIHKFKSVIYTLYQTNSSNEQVIKFTSDNGIKVVTMSKEYRYSRDFVSKLARYGIYTYVHTVNNIDVMQQLKKEGVHGFYTDFVTPNDYN